MRRSIQRRARRFSPFILLVLLAAACGTDASDEVAYRTFGQGSREVTEVHLDATETVQEIADGVRYAVWTFGGTAPGPVIRVKQGDTVRFTLNNKSTSALSHSIDFHAAQTPWNVNYVPVPPGTSLTFDWVARFPGVFMYHCGVPPVLHHIANGMYGAIIVEPLEPLPTAREYVLVASEFYAGSRAAGVHAGDVKAMLDAKPTQVVFNGKGNRYVAAPLVAKPDELIRLWVVNAGPTLDIAFHVIGALFDHVYPSGNPTSPMNGLQTWSVPPGDGAMFELRIPDAGQYPFVTHAFAYTGLGAVGLLDIRADAAARPARYPVMGSAADGGVTEAEGSDGDLPAMGAPVVPANGGHGGGPEIVTKDLAFAPSTLTVGSGEEVTLVDQDPIAHDLTIDAPAVKAVVGPNETVTFTAPSAPGTYPFYCSVPGHRAAGMEGTLTVR